MTPDGEQKQEKGEINSTAHEIERTWTTKKILTRTLRVRESERPKKKKDERKKKMNYYKLREEAIELGMNHRQHFDLLC